MDIPANAGSNSRDWRASARNAKSLTKTFVTTTASEWLFVWAMIGVVLIITTIPVIYAYLSAPAGKQYMGIMVNTPDHTQYFSWMREFTTHFLSPNKLTSEPNKAIFFNLLWFVLARVGMLISKDFSVTYRIMFEVMRIGSITLFLLVVYRMCAWFFEDITRRRAAFLIATFASGFGWVMVAMKYTVAHGELLNPLDVYVFEGNTLYSALGAPHFLGAAIYMLTFDLVLRGQAKRQWRTMFAAGLFAQFMGWQHAYDLVIVYGVLATYVVFLTIRDRRIPTFMVASVVLIGVLSVWPSLYSFLLTSLDPIWKKVLAQFGNAGVFTPPLYRLPVLMGAPIVLACIAVIAQTVRSIVGRGSPRGAARIYSSPAFGGNSLSADNALFVKAWFLISFLLIYLPVDFQIHMLNGWQVPIAILATVALFDVIGPFIRDELGWRAAVDPEAMTKRWLAVAMAVLILPTNVYLLGQRFLDLRRHDAPRFMQTSELAALKWLEAHVKPDDVVLSSETVGQYVPMLTGAHAYVAHWAETVDYFGKMKAVKVFFDANTADAERRKILDAQSVDYVVAGPEERALGNFNPSTSPALTLVYTNQDVNVYAVQKP